MADAIDHQLKRLDHLQSIIQRLAGNSFLIKGWAITLTSAILGFALKDPASTGSLAFLAILPTLAFWELDAYYLALERGMRHLYNDGSDALRTAHYNVAANLPDPQIGPRNVCFCGWLCAAWVPSTAVLYIVLLAGACAVGFGWFTKTVHLLIAI